jgi:hypothetical protein
MFPTVSDAKTFLISRIVAEALREHVPLSELEIKMLSFSEVEGSPDFEALNDAFEREYEYTEYEQKIGKLVRSFRTHARKTDQEELRSWNEAVKTLSLEDHYLLVLIKAKTVGSPDSVLVDRLKLFGLAFVIILVITIGVYVSSLFHK